VKNHHLDYGKPPENASFFLFFYQNDYYCCELLENDHISWILQRIESVK